MKTGKNLGKLKTDSDRNLPLTTSEELQPPNVRVTSRVVKQLKK